MKKLITLILASLLAIGCIFGLTACKDEKENVADVTPGIVTVGYTVYEPMNYTDDKGVFVGFDTELALRVFNALGYDVMFKEIDWDNKYLELNNGTIDCVWNGFTKNSTDEDANGNLVSRDTLCDFSLEYMMNGQCLFARSENNVANLSQLNGKTIVYEGSSAADTLINSEGSIFEGTGFIGSSVAYQMNACEQVLNGTKDYAVIDIILARSLIANNSSYSNFVICDAELGAEVYAIGFKTGSELTAKVNVMLKAFAQTGYLQELATKYGVSDMLISSWS